MGIFQNNLMGAAAAAASAGGGDFYSHQIANSARFTGSGTMSRTAGTPTNVDKFTISCWVKGHKLGTATNFVFGYEDNLNYQKLAFNSSDKLELHEQRGAGDSNGLRTVDQVFRDPSAWMHVVWVYDSGNATEADREIFYVNGTRLSDVEGWDGGYPTQNRNSVFNKSGATQHIGSASSYYGSYFQGYMAEVVFNDGQAYAASDYGETKNGVWIPKDPSGLTFGNNGFYLNFASSSDMGNDVSGNNNDFSESNVDTHDQMLDTPTFNSSSNGGNFATYNYLIKGSYTDLSEGNCRADSNTSADASYPAGTHGMTSGKWYYEQLIGNLTGSYPSPGLVALNNRSYSTTKGLIFAMRYRPDTGAAEQSSGDNIAPFGTITVNTTGVATAGTGDIVSWYVDMDNKKAWFAKNGSIPNSGDPANGTNPQFSWTENPEGGITFMSQEYQTSFTVVNAGQDGTFAGEKTAQGNSDDTGYGNFYYDPPTGFLALCSGNLPIADAINPAETDDDYPQKLHNPIIWTGNGGTLNVTGLGYQPDLVWYKRRDSASSNVLMDSTRGTSEALESNSSGSADTSFTSGITAFGADGFTLGNQSQGNASGGTYVGWSWRANGGGASNSDGATSSTVQAAPGGGFSIVTYTGFSGSSGTSTVGHGMGVAPNMIIFKSRTRTSAWWTAAPGLLSSQSHFLELNGTGTPTDLSSYGTISAPTTSVFTINGVDGIGGESANYVAYCFANIEGYCKVGTYEGNGSADGSFVYTGFRPSFVMTKMTDGSAEWTIYDDKRDPFNESDHVLQADLSDAERTDLDKIDILSNGFKCLSNGGRTNQSSKNYIYLAMAKNPFKYATAR